jgi:hypothetical protein
MHDAEHSLLQGLHIPDSPGVGLDWNEAVVAAIPSLTAQYANSWHKTDERRARRQMSTFEGKIRRQSSADAGSALDAHRLGECRISQPEIFCPREEVRAPISDSDWHGLCSVS